jgi:hypothetical protein
MNSACKLLLAVLLSVPRFTAAGEAEDRFREQYVEDMRPLLSERLSGRLALSGLADEEMQALIDRLVGLFADCQIRAFEGFEEKYRRIPLDAVGNGETIHQSNAILNAELQRAIAAGDATEESIVDQVEQVRQLFGDCASVADDWLE